MTRPLVFIVFLVGSLSAEEFGSRDMREKVRARIIESLPPAPDRPAFVPLESEEPVLVLEPIVVSESRGVRELAKQVAEDRQRREAEQFTPLKGGKIYSNDRLEVGGWWEPGKGWRFLKLKW